VWEDVQVGVYVAMAERGKVHAVCCCLLSCDRSRMQIDADQKHKSEFIFRTLQKLTSIRLCSAPRFSDQMLAVES
jgi:hypothetical protein